MPDLSVKPGIVLWFHDASTRGGLPVSTREPVQAGSFYPAGGEVCRREVEQLLAGVGPLEGPADPVAAISPHAGWAYSGPTAARAFAALKGASLDTLVVLAAHTGPYGPAEVSAHARWHTPLGDVAIDGELSQAIVEHCGRAVERGDRRLDREHSVEVQLPFLQVLFPEARLVAVALPSDEHAAARGRMIVQAAAELGRAIVLLGSTDLTHYGPPYGFTPQGSGEDALRWVREENDARMVELIRELEADRVVAEAAANQNACGAGAVAAALAGARERGRERATILHYTTSQDIHPERSIHAFVGYVAAVS